MASRLLKASGGDHTTIADWEAWVSDTANFGGTNWDDTGGNGGDQTLRFANETFNFASNDIDADALVTATYFKITFRPDTENSVTSVGEKVEADGTLPIATVSKTPQVTTSSTHARVINLTSSPNAEWHIEGLHLAADNAIRRGALQVPTQPTKDVYIDRCILTDKQQGNHAVINGGGNGSHAGKIYIRSCVMYGVDTAIGVTIYRLASNVYMLGCTIRHENNATLITGASSNQNPVKVYGCAFYEGTDGQNRIATNIAAANFDSDYNVANFNGTNWTDDFAGAADVSNSTIANMFVGSADQNPKVGGSLESVVSWSGLPADVQAAWPDTDFYGNTITKSGTFSAGAIYVPGAAGDEFIPRVIFM